MSRRFRPTDAFVDESIRGRRYIMGCVLVEARHLAELRTTMDTLSVTTSRIHFNNETDTQRRRVLDAIAEMQIEAFAVSCVEGHGVSEFRARGECVAEIVRRAQQREIATLVLESRQDDTDDERVIVRTRAPEPSLVFEHRTGRLERMLWIADAVTWAVGSGHVWSQRLDAVLTDVIELRL